MDLFSATPPCETLALLISICARRQATRDRATMAVVDIKRACFYAKARQCVLMEIPIQDREEEKEDMIGQLQATLYGTRDAAQNWAREYTLFLVELGFKVGEASPCNFVHHRRGLALTVHGDDFTIIGDETQVRWLGVKMKKWYDWKMDGLGTRCPSTNGGAYSELDSSLH